MPEENRITSTPNKSQPSNKIHFLLGLVSGIAVISLIALIIVLSNKGADQVEEVEEPSQIVEDQQPSEQQTIVDLATAIGLDKQDFESCLNDNRYSEKVDMQTTESDALDPQGRGRIGTPFTVVVGPDGEQIAVSGALPTDFFGFLVDGFLAGEEIDVANLPEQFMQMKDFVSNISEVDVRTIDDNDYVRGSREAKVQLIEYSDLRCGYCQKLHVALLGFASDYTNDELAWTYRHHPIPSISGHEQSPMLAQAAECAGELGGNKGFWDMIDTLFEG